MERRKRDAFKYKMKISFLYLETSKESWLQEAVELYSKKISRFSQFEIQKMKSPSLDRSSKEQKLKAEEKLIFNKIQPDDYLIVFDERGKEQTSIQFSEEFKKIIDRSPRRIVFLIGGAFGVSSEVLNRAQAKVSLSKLIFNHHVAIVVGLEQIYRSFTIQKNLPYHNI